MVGQMLGLAEGRRFVPTGGLGRRDVIVQAGPVPEGAALQALAGCPIPRREPDEVDRVLLEKLRP